MIKRKVKQNIILIILVLIVVVISSVCPNYNVKAQAKTPSNSIAFAVMEKESGRILDSKNAQKKLPMASTTKIATAITVIENCKNLDIKVKIPRQAIGVEGSSIYLNEQDELSVLDLLYGLMLQSGNDCAVALALTVGGSISNFANLMNETAVKAGAKSTNFVNPHGLHDENHYTTAQDLAKISAYAMKNPIFAKIVGTKRYATSWGGRDYGRVIINKNKILSTLDGGDGVKTGFTKKAGRCLVASATRSGMTIIAVVLNCPPMFEECSRHLENAFEKYKLFNVKSLILTPIQTVVTNGKADIIELSVDDNEYFPLSQSEINALNIEIEGVKTMQAPIKKGQENGKIVFKYANRLLFEQKLYTINSIELLDEKDDIKKIIEKWN